MTLSDQAEQLFASGELEKAFEAFERVAKVKEAMQGRADDELARIRTRMGDVRLEQAFNPSNLQHWQKQRRQNQLLEQAAEQYGRAVPLHAVSIGRDAAMAELLVKHAKTQTHRRMHREAADALKLAVEVRREVFGRQHAIVGETLMELGSAQRELMDIDAAAAALEEAQLIEAQTLGENDVRVARSLALVGGLRIEQGRSEDARQLLVRAHRVQEAQLGSAHVEVGRTLVLLGRACSKLAQFDAAMGHYQKAAGVLIPALGADHPEVFDCLSRIHHLQNVLSKFDVGHIMTAEYDPELDGTEGPGESLASRISHQRRERAAGRWQRAHKRQVAPKAHGPKAGSLMEAALEHTGQMPGSVGYAVAMQRVGRPDGKAQLADVAMAALVANHRSAADGTPAAPRRRSRRNSFGGGEGFRASLSSLANGAPSPAESQAGPTAASAGSADGESEPAHTHMDA